MKLPKQVKPVSRAHDFVGYSSEKSGIQASQLGTCVDNTGAAMLDANGNPARFNQAACCALRIAQNGGFWINPNNGAVVVC
jgi:hypothetical protein